MSLCLPDMVGSKTALVAADEFMRVPLELYKVEAAVLPFEIQIFNNRADALQWLNS